MLKFHTSALAALIVVAASTSTVFANAESDAKRCVTEIQNRVTRFTWNLQAITGEKLENIARALRRVVSDLRSRKHVTVITKRSLWANPPANQSENWGVPVCVIYCTRIAQIWHGGSKKGEETALESIRRTLRRQRAILQAELQ